MTDTRTRAEKMISFVEMSCRIPEGKDVGKKVRLRDWQKDAIKKIYDNPAGTRRVIFTMGRKNAKTALASFLLLGHLVGPERQPNSQLYSTAQSKDQAAVVFDLAAKIVRMSPQLAGKITIRDTYKQLIFPELGTKYKALSAEVATSFGLSPSFTIHDELGQVRGPTSELYDALEFATAAHDNPLTMIISTQAPTDADLLSILIDDAKQEHDPHTVLIMYESDPEADPFDEATIRQANPAFGDFQNAEEVMAMADAARRMPSREAHYRNVVLNQRVEASSPFISKTVWRENGEPVTADWGDAEVWGGLDLSAVNDLTALVLGAQIDKKLELKPTFWLPADGIQERSRLDRVPYDVWAREFKLMLTPGKSVEYQFVAHYLKTEVFDKMNVRKIAFDRWNFKHLKSWLLAEGFSEDQITEHFVEFGQGYQSMSPAMRAIESLLLSNSIRHGNHPVLTMCAANAVVNKDPAGNRKLDKAKSRGRIDGMVAATMCAAVAESTIKEPEAAFQMMFV